MKHGITDLEGGREREFEDQLGRSGEAEWQLFVRFDAAGGPAGLRGLQCSYKTFTNAEMLELETLGRVVTLAAGESVTHTERWSAFRG